MPMKASKLWMLFSGCVTVEVIGSSLGLMNSWLLVKTWWNFCLPMKPWQSTGSTKAGACLALPRSAISRHIGTRSCMRHCSSTKNGHGIREHLQLPWWKTLLVFALACLEQCMQELFRLAPLRNIWCMPCGCGTKAEEKIVLGSHELGRILVSYFLMFLINLDACWNFLWSTFLGQTNKSWSHGNDKQKVIHWRVEVCIQISLFALYITLIFAQTRNGSFLPGKRVLCGCPAGAAFFAKWNLSGHQSMAGQQRSPPVQWPVHVLGESLGQDFWVLRVYWLGGVLPHSHNISHNLILQWYPPNKKNSLGL